MAEFPAMPLWTDRLLGDCGLLSDADFGLYMKILIQMWRAQDGLIPDDDKWLAQRFGRSVADVQRDMRPLINQFCVRRGNMLTQRRLQKELEYVRTRRAKQREKAKSRWDKEKGLYRGNAEHAPAMPLVSKKITTSEYDAAKDSGKREEKSGANGKSEDLAVSPALAAKYTRQAMRH